MSSILESIVQHMLYKFYRAKGIPIINLLGIEIDESIINILGKGSV